MKLHLIMPMGGGGTRFIRDGFECPKPLIEIYDKPFFYWATQSIRKFTELASLTFVVLQEHIDRFSIDARILALYPDAEIQVIPQVFPGAVMTCLAGVEHIPVGQPILFNDCDHLFICNSFYEFCKADQFEEVDGGLLTFTSTDPRFSFVAFDKCGFVKRTVEKQAISENAICGAYFFNSKEIFKKAAQAYLKKCEYQEFFMSGVYNIMAVQGQKIRSYNVDAHVSFGTPEELSSAKSNQTYLKLL